ncbi:MAG: Rieske (2Fe-2S) protein [Candidatus Aminicenantes bacterium]|nr:Rieske (2Fe-2S) protein [Candidatus Aminicenantes bacterium]
MSDKNIELTAIEVKSSRRGFIKYFLFGNALTWAGAAFYGLIRFFSPFKAATNALPRSVILAKHVDQVERNSGLIFRYGEKPAILIHTKNDEFLAYFAACPHLGCLVQYSPRAERIICPCHDGVFDLHGKNISGPPTEPLDPLEVKIIRKHRIQVSIPGVEME